MAHPAEPRPAEQITWARPGGTRAPHKVSRKELDFTRVTALVVMRGLPGAGKSTLAGKWVAQCSEHRAEVNRDALRVMLHGGFSGPECEGVVTVVQHRIISTLLAANISVICSDTNLSDERMIGFTMMARRADVPLVTWDLRHIPLATCLERNAQRTGAARVPDDSIIMMYERHIALSGNEVPE